MGTSAAFEGFELLEKPLGLVTDLRRARQLSVGREVPIKPSWADLLRGLQ